jgi:hypothetical protein
VEEISFLENVAWFNLMPYFQGFGKKKLKMGGRTNHKELVEEFFLFETLRQKKGKRKIVASLHNLL